MRNLLDKIARVYLIVIIILPILSNMVTGVAIQNQDKINFYGSCDDTFTIDAPLKDYDVKLDMLYDSNGDGIWDYFGSSSTKRLISKTCTSSFTINMDTDEYFIITKVNGKEAESAVLQLTKVHSTDGITVKDYDGNVVAADKKVDKTFDAADMTLTVLNYSQSASTATFEIKDPYCVNNSIVTVGGLQINFPDNLAIVGKNKINITLIETNDYGNIGLGTSVNVELGFNNNKTTVSNVDPTNIYNGFKRITNSSRYVGYTISNLSSKLIWDKSDTQYVLEMIYPETEQKQNGFIIDISSNNFRVEPNDKFNMTVTVENNASFDIVDIGVTAIIKNINNVSDIVSEGLINRLDSGDNDKAELSFNIPYSATSGNYSIVVTVMGTSANGTDYEVIKNITNKLEVYICNPIWVLNSTWSRCGITDNQYKNYYDANNCRGNVTPPNYINQSCDYCIPQWQCSNYSACQLNDRNQCDKTIDAYSCYSQTNLSSDLYIGNYLEFDYGYCDYNKDGLIGNISNVNTTLTNLTLKIQNQTTEFKDGNDTTIIFDYDFSIGTLNLFNTTLEKQGSGASKGYLRIVGIDLTSQNKTKSVYMDRIDASSNRICIVDAEILDINQISSGCTGANEVSLTCDGSQQGNYKCILIGSKYKIEGLSHSAAIEYTYTAPNNGGGNGGGGGGTPKVQTPTQPTTPAKIPLQVIQLPKKETKTETNNAPQLTTQETKPTENNDKGLGSITGAVVGALSGKANLVVGIIIVFVVIILGGIAAYLTFMKHDG